MAERKAVTKQMAKRYDRASKKDKGRLLDELCALTGWTRRHARRALRVALGPAEPSRAVRPRPRTYGEDVVEPLRVVWATLNGPAGKRLAPFMLQAVEGLERHGELRSREEVRVKLLRISAATIDRVLAPERRRLKAARGSARSTWWPTTGSFASKSGTPATTRRRSFRPCASCTATSGRT